MFIPLGKRDKNFNVPLVIEFGGLTTRGGYAGYDTPSIQIPTDFALNSPNDIELLDFYRPNGPEKAEINNFVNQCGSINWEYASSFMEQITKNLLRIEQSETPLFLIEQAFQTKDSRQKCVEAVFESMNFASLFIHKAPVLSSYIFAKETMLLVDSGAYNTYVVPIIEGYVNQKGVIRSDIAGEYLTKQLRSIWEKKVQSSKSYNRFLNYDKLTNSMKNWGANEITREIKSRNIKIKEIRQDSIKFNVSLESQLFELPDKTKIEVNNEMYETQEIFFNPQENFMGLQDLIKQSIERVESENRKELLNNIMVVGGNSMIPNFIERLQREIFSLEINIPGKIKIYTTPTSNERAHSSWIGASIVASMGSFENMLMTKRDYEEHGAILIERKIIF
ncbi:hypothetical protein IMG5_026550 [Ichthyophthirius multifiliis]|uniref:Actin n=1 Tax=Ichthyophthirius multifiliis TaxID=5932 RepID=G0QL73_ICHMU|nr:hypothetical protein IMG5_026550 [Ichthyophthirius multifiliis]EGR34034.1 hypothetical protein IMG5_026550 [Ichthyophthirius multifiliis]|eukprot:XP_004039338.1 hypothetical protein IMG5_026550 [Ichthyophthirius multifiliis]